MSEVILFRVLYSDGGEKIVSSNTAGYNDVLKNLMGRAKVSAVHIYRTAEVFSKEEAWKSSSK